MTTNRFRGPLAAVLLAVLAGPSLAQPLQNRSGRQDQGGGRYAPNQRAATTQNGRYQQTQTNQSPTRRGNAAGNTGNRGQARSPITRQPNSPRVSVPRGQQPARPAARRLRVFRPEWADNLLPRHKKHLLEILRYWEFQSDKINTYRCRFQRWEYDSVFGPRNDCKTYSVGELKYAKPDKGLFKVEKVMTYQPPQKQGAKPTHVELPGVMGEHWICDGMSIFEHDHRNRKLIEREIPPSMRGTAITNGPLPFMFGAKADKILSRYWIRVITPPSVMKRPEKNRQYWLEAYPKRPEDAANFLKVHVIIDYQKYLPQGLVMFDRGYRPPQNDSRTVFRFDQRKINFNNNFLQLFMRDFSKVKTPRGWERVITPVDPGPNASRPMGQDRRAARPAPRRR